MRPHLPQIRLAQSALVALALTGTGIVMSTSRAGEASAQLLRVLHDDRPARSTTQTTAQAVSTSFDSLALALSLAAPDLDRSVLELALQSQESAVRGGFVPDPSTLTVIDYSRPSVEPRFFVFDLNARALVFEELVAHGRNSGENVATAFANSESSLKTSLGLFVTLDTYEGEHGRSLRLEGLEPGFNDHARSRGIVIHGAEYVSQEMAARYGRIGRSWGCPALPCESAQKVIDRIRGGSAVFAFYPDWRWLTASRFIGADAGLPVAKLPAESTRTRSGSAGDVFLPDGLNPKLERLWAWKVGHRERPEADAPLFCS